MSTPELDPRLRQRLVDDTPARRWVTTTLVDASVEPHLATSAFRTASREARKLRSRERRALWDVVYDLVRKRDALSARGAGDWEERLDAWLADPEVSTDLPDAVRLGCIPEIAADLRHTYGDALEDWLAASNARAPTFLRVNIARTARAKLQAWLARDGIQTREVGTHGLEVEGRANLVGHPSFKQGHFEIQDLASQQVAERVEPSKCTVLDLCAGAGGKTLALAALGGRVVATDIRRRALDELRNRAKRAHARVEVHALDGPVVTLLGGRRFDRVLVDAPCTGTGVWRRHPEFRWRVDAAELERLTQLQRELLDIAADRTNAKGRVIYATCSALTCENEAVVEAFLATHPDWERTGPDLRTAPHIDGTDGMFAATLQRL